MAPVWVVLKEPVVPKRRLGREREAVSDKERPLSPNSVRALRTDPGRSGTRVMMEPPSWLKNEGPLVPTLTTSAMYEPLLGRTRAAKDDNDDYTETSALSGRSMDTTGEPGGSSSGSNLRPGQRQALEFAMRGLSSFDDGSDTRGKNSFLRVKPRRPGEPPTVLEKIVAKHDQRDAEVELKAQEMERRRLARTAAIDQGLDDPGNSTNTVHGSSGMNQAQKASAAAATAGDAQKLSTRDKMKEFVTRPSNLDSSAEATSVLRKKRAPRPRPPTPPRTAFAGSASIGGRTNLAKGKHEYKLTKESAFYDRARAVAVAHHGPSPEEMAAKAKADEEAAKAELKKRQLVSAKEGVQAFIMKGYKDEDFAERQAAQEAQEAARKAREEDGDYVSRTRKAAEKSMGSGLTPHYSSKTKLIFDRKEREIMQAFLSSGKRGPLGPLGQGLLAGDDATSLGAGSGMTSSVGGESRSTRAWSRWGNSSHGTTAVAVTDLVKMSAKASKVNRDLIVALKEAGQHTTAQSVANAAQFATPSVKAKIAGKGALYTASSSSSSPERAAHPTQAADSNSRNFSQEAHPTQTGEGGHPDSPRSARSGGSGYSSLTNMSLKQKAKNNYTSPPDARDGGFGPAGRTTCGDADMVTRRATNFAEGGERAIRSGDDDQEADEADDGVLSPRAIALKKRREERAARRAAGEAWLQSLAGTPWDPHVATCSHKGCQGCAYHALRARTSFDEPGPSTYALPDLATQVPGGKFNASKAKSNLDWVEYYEKQKVSLKLEHSSSIVDLLPLEIRVVIMMISFQVLLRSSQFLHLKNNHAQPGPADYPDRSSEKVGGGRFNSSKAKTNLDWVIYLSGQTPAPGAHTKLRAAQASVLPNVGVGAKFNLGNPKSSVDWQIYEHSKLPGPGEHGDCRVPAMDRLSRTYGSSTKGTFGVQDHHPAAKPPAPHIPRLRAYNSVADLLFDTKGGL